MDAWLIKLITSKGVNGHGALSGRMPQFKHPIMFEFDSSLTIFIGSNGSGKTSILETIWTLIYRFDKESIEKEFLGNKVIGSNANIRSIYLDLTGEQGGTCYRQSENLHLIVSEISYKSKGEKQLYILQNLHEIKEWQDGKLFSPHLFLFDEVGSGTDPTIDQEIIECLVKATASWQIILATYNQRIVQGLFAKVPQTILYCLSQADNKGKPIKHIELTTKKIKKLFRF